eukprot:1230606-Alexandrium_andersonii.AAC.1
MNPELSDREIAHSADAGPVVHAACGTTVGTRPQADRGAETPGHGHPPEPLGGTLDDARQLCFAETQSN